MQIVNIDVFANILLPVIKCSMTYQKYVYEKQAARAFAYIEEKCKLGVCYLILFDTW